MRNLASVLAICALLLLGSAPSVHQASAMVSSAARPLEWLQAAPMLAPRYTASVAVSQQEMVYVIGGDNFSCTQLTTNEEYNPRTNSWRARAAMPTGRWGAGAATGTDGKIYVIGGQRPGAGYCESVFASTVEAYDPRSDTWAARADMPTPRVSLGVAAAANGKIYAMGGINETGVLSVVEEYNPASDTWTRKADMPVPRRAFATVSASNGKIYVIGGDGYTNQVWEFDPVADTWTQKMPMPTGRDSLGAAQARNGLIYAVGGFGPSSPSGRLNTVEEYDPATDTWVSQTPLYGARSHLAVAAVRNVIYAIGGWEASDDGSGGPVGRVEAGRSVIR